MEVSVFPDILNTVAELYIETNLCAFQPHTQHVISYFNLKKKKKTAQIVTSNPQRRSCNNSNTMQSIHYQYIRTLKKYFRQTWF